MTTLHWIVVSVLELALLLAAVGRLWIRNRQLRQQLTAIEQERKQSSARDADRIAKHGQYRPETVGRAGDDLKAAAFAQAQVKDAVGRLHDDLRGLAGDQNKSLKWIAEHLTRTQDAIARLERHTPKVEEAEERIRAAVDKGNRMISEQLQSLITSVGVVGEASKSSSDATRQAVQRLDEQIDARTAAVVKELDNGLGRARYERLPASRERYGLALDDLRGQAAQQSERARVYCETLLRLGEALERLAETELSAHWLDSDENRRRLEQRLLRRVGNEYAPLVLEPAELELRARLQREVELYQGYLVKELRERHGVEPILPQPLERYQSALHDLAGTSPAPSAEHHNLVKEVQLPGLRVQGTVTRRARVICFEYAESGSQKGDPAYARVPPGRGTEPMLSAARTTELSQPSQGDGGKQAGCQWAPPSPGQEPQEVSVWTDAVESRLGDTEKSDSPTPDASMPAADVVDRRAQDASPGDGNEMHSTGSVENPDPPARRARQAATAETQSGSGHEAQNTAEHAARRPRSREY